MCISREECWRKTNDVLNIQQWRRITGRTTEVRIFDSDKILSESAEWKFVRHKCSIVAPPMLSMINPSNLVDVGDGFGCPDRQTSAPEMAALIVTPGAVIGGRGDRKLIVLMKLTDTEGSFALKRRLLIQASEVESTDSVAS